MDPAGRLDKVRGTSFDPLLDGLRIRPKTPARPGRISRLFASREYGFRFDRGRVIETKSDGFGFDGMQGPLRIKAAHRDVPPVGSDLTLVLGERLGSDGSPLPRRAPILIGALTSDGVLHAAKASWPLLHGRPLRGLLLFSLLITLPLGFAWHQDLLRGAIGVLGPFLLVVLLFASVLWLLRKSAQLWRARRLFAGEVTRLSDLTRRD